MRERFELPYPQGESVLQTDAFSRSATHAKLEEGVRFELTVLPFDSHAGFQDRWH